MPEPLSPAGDTPPTDPIGWRELVHDFLKPSRGQLMTALVLLLCGLAVVMQVRTNAAERDYSALRRADLVQLLDDLNAESNRLESEIATLERTKERLQTGADRQEVARQEAERRLEVLSILAGTAPAQGPGVRITITDPYGKVNPEILLNAIEELRDAGAEVMEVNDSIRVTASTWVSSGPDGLIMDDRAVSRPIVLEAIGDAHALTEAAQFRGGLVSEVEGDRIGGVVSISSDATVVITSIRAPKAPRFARPA